MAWRKIKLDEVLYHRKQFITIDDSIEYKRCRVQVNRKGVILRDIIKGLAINTKKQQVCRSGDFLVAEIDAKVGGYGFINDELEGAIVSSHYFLFEIQEEKMLPIYFAHLIRTDIIQSQINSRGSTNYAAIRPAQFLSFEIMLPSLKEQQEIVNKISSLEKVYTPFQKEIDLQISDLKLLRQSILQEAIQGKLVPQDATDEPASVLLEQIKKEKQRFIDARELKKEKSFAPIEKTDITFKVPEKWIWCRLGEVCNLITDGTHQTPKYVERGAVFLSAQNVKPFKFLPRIHRFVSDIDHKDYIKNRKAEKGDVLLTRVGAGIGEAAVINIDIEFSFYVSLSLLKPGSGLNSFYLELFLNSPLGKKHSYNKTLGRGVSAGNLNLSLIRNFELPLPPINEQKRIVSKVNQLMRLCDEIEEQITRSKTEADQFLQGFLREAFDGNRAVLKKASRQDEVLWQKKLLASYINMLMEQRQEQGEMAIAKYTYLNDRVHDAGSGFRYVQHNFGPYSSEIKDCLTSLDAPFYKKIVGKKGYEVYHVNKELETAFIDPANEALQEAQNGFRQLMQVFSVFPMRERARQLELVASVCWLIEEQQSTDINTLYDGLKNWPTPKREVRNKSELFTKKEVGVSLKLIQKHKWHIRLLQRL